MYTSNNLLKKQQGMTAIGWLFVLGLIGFFVLLALRLFPIYSNNFKLKGILETVSEEHNLYELDRNEILVLIDKGITINRAEGFKKEHFEIVLKENRNKEFRIKYEDRRPILGNLDVVAKFDDYVVIAPNGALRRGL
ncbi:MAG: DUF4845 domain-containing protein [Gammaproteobacteria bacterium]|nr:DUF4845 domain-containing protein [Gammaproteobacteria bacterium]